MLQSIGKHVGSLTLGSVIAEAERWIERLAAGDQRAPEVIWHQYFEKIQRFAKRRLRDMPRRSADEQDVALSAFNSFFQAANEDKFPKLSDRDDLWKLLITITARKVSAQQRKHFAEKRGGGRVSGESVFADLQGNNAGFANFLGTEPTPELVAVMEEQYDHLLTVLDDETLTYIGKIRYKDETHEGEHDGIVPLDLFRRVQNQLKANGQSGGTGVRNKHNALLKGLIWCKACGRPMTLSYSCKGSKRYRYYVCGTAMQEGWAKCPAPSVPAGEIERFVVEQIQTIGTDEDLLNQTIGQIESRSDQLRTNLEAERKSLQRQLRNDHEKLRAIAANVSNNGRVAGLPELQTRIDTAEDRLKAIASELQSLEAQAIDTADVRRLLAGFEELWQTIQPREQVRLTSLLVDRVDFDGVASNVGITFHDTGMQSLTAGNMEVLA